jgi:hypothetical protein
MGFSHGLRVGRRYGTMRTPSTRPDCARLWSRMHSMSRFDVWNGALSQITTNHRRRLRRTLATRDSRKLHVVSLLGCSWTHSTTTRFWESSTLRRWRLPSGFRHETVHGRGRVCVVREDRRNVSVASRVGRTNSRPHTSRRCRRVGRSVRQCARCVPSWRHSRGRYWSATPGRAFTSIPDDGTGCGCTWR